MSFLAFGRNPEGPFLLKVIISGVTFAYLLDVSMEVLPHLLFEG
jgi:hypothetical protein